LIKDTGANIDGDDADIPDVRVAREANLGKHSHGGRFGFIANRKSSQFSIAYARGQP